MAVTESVGIAGEGRSGPGRTEVALNGSMPLDSRWLQIELAEATDTVQVANLSVRGFKADYGGAVGISNTVGTVQFEHVLFTENNATRSGGAVMLEDDTVGGVMFVNTSFVANVAARRGGAVALDDDTVNATFRSCEWLNNRVDRRSRDTDYGGGAVHLYLRNTGIRFEDCLWRNNSATFGGAVSLYRQNDDVRFERCTWMENVATTDNGGAMNLRSENTRVSVLDSTLWGNVARRYGGGVHADSGNVELSIQNCTLKQNAAQLEAGGGTSLGTTNQNTTIQNVSFVGNEAPFGGGLYVYNGNVDVQVRGSVFFHNNATDSGGGAALLFSNERVQFVETTFAENFVMGNAGGALYIYSANSRVTLRDSVFRGNWVADTDTGIGAGLHIAQYNLDISAVGCRWENHTVALYGAAVFIDTENNGTSFSQCRWENNTARFGPALYANRHNTFGSIAASTFIRNTGRTDGGAIHFETQNRHWRFDSVAFVDNVAWENGGAVFMDTFNEENSFTGCLWQNNSAIGDGGGLYLNQYNNDLRFTDCTWRRNVGGSGSSDGAGAFLNEYNTGSWFVGCRWEENRARSGAGLHFALTTYDVQIRGGTFENNSVTTYGGGVNFGDGGSLFLINGTTFRNCSALSGGALYLGTAAYRGQIRSCVFDGNSARTSGGAVVVNQDAEGISFDDITAEHNNAASDGGFLYLLSNNEGVIVQRSALRDNAAGGSGGAIANVLSCQHCYLVDVVCDGNTAAYGGAMSTGQDDQWLLSKTTMTNNTASVEAGALHSDEASLVVITQSTLESNTALLGDGGGLLLSGSTTALLHALDVFNNTAAQGSGGGIALSESKTYLGGTTRVHGNAAPAGNGGGIDVSNGGELTFFRDSSQAPLVLLLASLFPNSSIAAFIQNSSTADVSATLAANTATAGGGLAASTTAALEMNGVVLADNIAFGAGGGAALSSSSASMNQSTTFLRNTATAGGGIAVDAGDAEVELLHGTSFVANVAQVGGGAMYVADGSVSFAGVEMSDNIVTDGGGGGIYWEWDSVGSATLVDVEQGDAVTFSSNSALYGTSYATPAFNLSSPATGSGTSGSSANPIPVHVVDFYNQTVTSYTGFTQATVSGGGRGCSSPSLAGATVVNFEDGVADFSELRITCSPGSLVSTHFSLIDAEQQRTFRTSTVVELDECHLGEVVISDVCEVCGLGAYSWETVNATSCTDCPSHAKCPAESGWKIDVDEGYWRQKNFSTRIRWCPASKACRGGTNTDDQCKTGSSGPLCLVCDPGWYQPSSLATCKRCHTAARYAPLAIVAVLVVAALAVFLWLRHSDAELAAVSWVQERYDKMGWLRDHAKVILAYVQILAQYQFLFSVSYPPAFVSASSALGLSNLGFSTLFSPHCWNSNYNFFYTLTSQTAGAVAIVFVGGVWFAVRRIQLLANPDERERIVASAISWLVFFLYLILPGTSTVIFQVFACDDNFDGGKSYMKADYSISCNTQTYHEFVQYAAVCVFIFPVGIIALFATVLWTHREHICPDVAEVIDEVEAKRSSDTKDIEEREGVPADVDSDGDGDGDTDTDADADADADAEAGVDGNGDDDDESVLVLARLANDVQECDSLIPKIQHKEGASASAARCAASVRRNLRYEYRSRDKSLAALTFLFESYKPEMWFMEMVECLRRLLMSSLLVFFWPGSSSQIVSAMIVCAFFIALYGWLQPYMRERVNRVAIAGLWCVLSQLFVSLLILENVADSHSTALGVLMVSAMVLAPLLPFTDEIYDAAMAWYAARRAPEEPSIVQSGQGAGDLALVNITQLQAAEEENGDGALHRDSTPASDGAKQPQSDVQNPLHP